MQRQTYANGKDLGEDIEQKMELLKYQYDLIIIDTYMEEKMQWNARLSALSDITILVAESSYFGNIKARELWEKNKFVLDQKKTKILFNRYSKNSLYKTRLISNFSGIPILGFISERKCYAQNINLSHQEHYGGFFERREYKKILNRIFHPEKMNENEWINYLKQK